MGDWVRIAVASCRRTPRPRLVRVTSSLRAIENGYALVRQDFNGWSAAYNQHGQPLATQDTTVDHDPWIVDVPTHGVTTLYRLTGDTFAWLCLAGTLVLIGMAVIPRRSPTRR